MNLKKIGSRILSLIVGILMLIISPFILYIYVDAADGSWFSGFAFFMYFVIAVAIMFIVSGFSKKEEKKKPEEKKVDLPVEKKE